MQFLAKKEDTEKVQLKADIHYLTGALRDVVQGNATCIDTAQLHSQELGEVCNQLLDKYVNRNNEYVLTLNEGLNVVGNSLIVKEMLDSVTCQVDSLKKMKGTSDQLSQASTHIADVVTEANQHLLKAAEMSKNSVEQINKSVEIVNNSYEDINNINEMVKTFKSNTAKITEIIDIVKNIALQTNLLSLNASIEAARAGEFGRGFGVVAREVKNLAEDTKKSTEDIADYIAQLQKNIDELVLSIDNTSDKIKTGNTGVQESITNINQVHNYIDTLSTRINQIETQIETQKDATGEFSNSMDQLFNQSHVLNEQCFGVGNLMFMVSRKVDAVRGRIARFNSHLTLAEWIDVYKTDHIIYTWRLLNHIYQFENLDLNNINNPNTCKLGKWYTSTDDVQSSNNPIIREIKATHEQLHEKGVCCYMAVQDKDTEKALQRFKECEPILRQLLILLDKYKQNI